MDIATKKISWLTKENGKRREFSPDGKREDTRRERGWRWRQLYLHDLATGKSTALPIPKGITNLPAAIPGFTKDGSRLEYYHNGPTAPGDIVGVYTLATKKSYQVAHSLVAGVHSEDMVVYYLVHYPQPRRQVDHLRISLHPLQHGAQRQTPASSCEPWRSERAQTMNSFNRFIRSAGNQGYMVLAPNYGGSTNRQKISAGNFLSTWAAAILQTLLAGVQLVAARARLRIALYSAGLCTPHDLPTAYRWFALALRKDPDNQSVQTDLQKLWGEMTQPERQLAIKLSQ